MTVKAADLDGFKFLAKTFDEEILRAQAQNILDSYAHPWDLLAEALQNSVDAIEQKIAKDRKAKAHISIVFNCKLRSVEVSDTGIGMSAEELKEVLAPGKSLKRGKAGLRGEKGVGVSFIVFASNRFRIESSDGKQTTSIQIDSANNWIRGSEPKEPQFTNVSVGEVQQYRGSKTYTRIWIEEIPAKPDEEEDLFNYSEPRLVHILRSKTAVGNTFPLFNQDARPKIDIDVDLQYVDEAGVKTSSQAVEYAFASPAEYLKPSEVITWDAYQAKLAQAKARTLKGKCLVRTGVSTSDTGKEVRWYAMATSRKTYDRISEEFELRTASVNDVEPGIFVATRGMPTGIVLAPPRSQQAAYWPSFFILLEYDAIRWDLGRKFVGGRIAEMLKKIALKDIFNEIVDHIPQFIEGGASELAGLEGEKKLDEIKEDVRKTPDLGLKTIAYIKEPRHEQGVIAIFHELAGCGILKFYGVLRSSAREQYDAYVRYSVHRDDLAGKVKERLGKARAEYDIFIEFKYEAADFLPDLETRKRARDVKLLVCWQLTQKPFDDQNIDVEEIGVGDSIFIGATHKLTFSNRYQFGGENQLFVLCLKDFVATLKGAKTAKKVKR